jgi:hypothetical protein
MVRKLQLNPAVILYVTNALVAMAVAWGWHGTADQIGSVDVIVSGVLTIIGVFTVRPVVLPTAAAAAVTVLTAFSAWGLHQSPDQIATACAVASIIVGFLLHAAGVPTVAAKQGTTARAILLGAPNPGSQ